MVSIANRLSSGLQKTFTPRQLSFFDGQYFNAEAPGAPAFANFFGAEMQKGNASAQLVASIFNKAAKETGGMIGVNDYGIKGKRQYIADRRYLLDLYVIALNNADIRTATTHLRNEIFRRGIEYEPAFDYKCDQCGREYSVNEARKAQGVCPDCKYQVDERGQPVEGEPQAVMDPATGQQGFKRQAAPAKLRKADDGQIKQFIKFLKRANYFGQSLENVLRECEDDLNVVDDAFLYCRKRYLLSEEEELKAKAGYPAKIEEELIHVFRLDPVLVEFDLDYRGIPGMRHHVCVFHRDNLLEVEPDAGWEIEWKGQCPECGLTTKPIYYKYNEQYLQGGYGTAQSKVLYLSEDEVIHWSRYTPTETYGYPPLLSIYEKALTLVGMDRYLYDYFYERKVPQGVVTVVTDNVEGFNATKAEVEARMQQDPHYIPWMAISSKSGQGKMEFVRFAYSLDELNYLPVRDEIRERISGLYGVSSIWMASMQGTGGLNNETQQLTVMSRVVEGAQRSYQTDVFPKLEDAMGVSDWHLVIKTPEETNELAEIQIHSARAGVAQQMVAMGFGARYDAEAKEFTHWGEIQPLSEQQAMQASLVAGGVQGGGGNLPNTPNTNQKVDPPPGKETEESDGNN